MALDRLGARSHLDLRIREVDPHRQLRVIATVVAAVAGLAVVAWWVAYLVAG